MDENDRQVLADEKARLEVDKLKAEIADLKHGGMVGARFARNGALITALFTAAGGVFALFQFNAQQEANRAQLKTQSDQLEAGRREELQKVYWQEQKKVYDRAVHSAALISEAPSLADVVNERKEFKGLFVGDISSVESSEVAAAMVDFAARLSTWEQSKRKPEDIASAAFQLAHCTAQSLAKTWRPAPGRKVLDEVCPYH